MSVIQLKPITDRVKRPYPAGRTCASLHCTQPLSQYNEKSICNACWLKGMPAEERDAA